MTPEQAEQAAAFRAACQQLNLPQSAAAHFFQVDVSTIRRWDQRGPPYSVMMVLDYCIARALTPDAFAAAIRRTRKEFER
jgi:hypothetical protein